MKRLKAIVAYDGSGFSGFQVQPGKRTVQLMLMQALGRMHKQEWVKVTASGRTDANVHATGQVIHFDTPLTIPPERWRAALNGLLPADVRIVQVEETAPDFHARYSVSGKTYRYKWRIGEVESPFSRHYAVHLRKRPDIAAMRKAAAAIVGTHDFSSFCAANTSVTDKVRTVRRLELEEHGEELHLVIEGSGFLYNMVRIIAGTLLEVGTGRRLPEELAEIVSVRDRSAAGKTAAPHGLYLEEVHYEK